MTETRQCELSNNECIRRVAMRAFRGGFDARVCMLARDGLQSLSGLTPRESPGAGDAQSTQMGKATLLLRVAAL